MTTKDKNILITVMENLPQNYILIKKYPSSPEIGYITNFNEQDEDWSPPNMLIVDDCKDFPEFWISTKDYFNKQAELWQQ